MVKEPEYHTHLVTIGPEGCPYCKLDKLYQDQQELYQQLTKLLHCARVLMQVILTFRLHPAEQLKLYTDKTIKETNEAFKFLGVKNESITQLHSDFNQKG